MYRYDYATKQPVHTGGAQLMVGSGCWPTTGADPNSAMAKISTWLDKPTVASVPSVKNWHVGAAVLVLGVGAYVAHKKRWL
jgi:hypothetical protein